MTPFFSTLWIRCGDVFESESADTYVIEDGLDSYVEVKLTGDNDADTLAEVSIDSDSYDSGLESSLVPHHNVHW